METYININILRIKRMTKAMGYILLQILMVTLTLSCNSYAQLSDIKVIDIKESEPLSGLSYPEVKSCQNWKMSAHEAKIFLSRGVFFKNTHFNIFDIYPCSISGKAFIDKKFWNFNINASGWTELSSGNEKKYFFGCITENDECYKKINDFKDLEN